MSISSFVLADDWPQWRGPKRNDISEEKGLLKEWPAGGPPKVWVYQNAGLGYSGPAISQGKLFTMGAREGKEYLVAVDAAQGKELWAAEMGKLFKNDWGEGPRGTPAVDGDRVYGLGGEGTLICAQASDGKVLWKKRMEELGGGIPHWGYTESVLVDDKHVICTPGGSQGALAALDKMSGKVAWQSRDFTDAAHYASVVPAEPHGLRQYVQLTEQSIVGIAADSGKTLWKSPFPGATAVIPTPIYRDTYVYVTAGYQAGCKLLQILADQKPKEIYANKTMQNHHGGVVLVGDHIYGHSDRGGWLCQKFLTGEQVWSERSKLGKGAVACADGMLYCQEESSGTVALVEASPEGWKEHGRLKLNPLSSRRSPRGRVWTHPVIANGRLYLRDQEFLVCYNIQAN